MTQPSGAGSFRIDLERAPDALRELEGSLAELYAIKKDAAHLGQVDPGSRDSVSVDAATMFGRAAVGGPGSLMDALDAGIAQLEQLIASMRAELAAYRENEGGTARSLSDARGA